MTPEIATPLADHGARITNLEQGHLRIEGKLDKLVFGMLGTFVTGVAGLIFQLFKR